MLWTSETQCAKDMISMKSLTFSSHTSGAKVRHQGPPGTAEAQPLIIIISFKVTMVDHSVTNISLPPFPHGAMIWETEDKEKFKPQQLCTQQVYWVLYVIVYTYTQVILLKQAIPGTLSEENRLIMLFIPRRELIQKEGILGWKVCGVMNDASISWC